MTFLRALYTATTVNPGHPVVLRTYRPRATSLNSTVVEAICATMVTPPYFSPINCGPHRQQQVFIGGPRGANNPTRELLKEASAVFGNEKLVSQILSLGSGRGSVQEIAADCEAVARELSTRFCDMDAYLRLNVDRGIENVLMNEWDDLGPIGIHTCAYVETADVSNSLDASLRRIQGGAGTVTLGEISAYFRINPRESVCGSVTDVGQIIPGQQTTCKACSIITGMIWLVPSWV
jgi:hypothetical protein